MLCLPSSSGSFWQLLAFLGLQLHHSVPCLHPLVSVSKFPPLTRTPVIRSGSTSTQPDLHFSLHTPAQIRFLNLVEGTGEETIPLVGELSPQVMFCPKTDITLTYYIPLTENHKSCIIIKDDETQPIVLNNREHLFISPVPNSPDD